MKGQKAKVKSCMHKTETTYKTDLKARCYSFGLAVIKLTDALPQKRSAWVIADQIIRSSTSIGANIVEAKASTSRLEFKRFYEISLKSANESIYWLNLLKDAGLAQESEVNKLLVELEEICRMLGKSVISLKQKL